MSFSRGRFTYTTPRGTRGGANHGGRDTPTSSLAIHSQRVSPRKRPRSPDTLNNKTTSNVATPTINDPIDLTDDNDIDSLCNQALDDYESQVTTPTVSILHPPSSVATPNTSVSRPHVATPIITTPTVSTSIIASKSTVSRPHPPHVATPTDQHDLLDKVRQLEDRILTLEGESTYLRQQLQKKEEEHKKMERGMKEYREEMASKEKLYETNLQYKSQEIVKLEHKVSQLQCSMVPVRPLVQKPSFHFSSEDFVPPTQQMANVPQSLLTHRNTPAALKETRKENEQNITSKVSQIHKPRSSTGSTQTEPHTMEGCGLESQHFEMQGPQLLKLLVKPQLQTIPNYYQLVHTRDSSSPQEDQSLGLFSLLYVPSNEPAIDCGVTGESMVTPINQRCRPLTSETPRNRVTSPSSHGRVWHNQDHSSDRGTSSLSPNTPQSLSSLNFLSSISLKESIASLLCSGSNFNKMPQFSFESLGNTVMKALDSNLPDCGVSLLPLFESILSSFDQDPTMVPDNTASGSTQDSTDNRGYVSGRGTLQQSASSSSGSSCDSYGLSQISFNNLGKPSSEFSHSSGKSSSLRIEFRKQQLCHTLKALETLCMFSQQVREAILFSTPKLAMESRSSSYNKLCEVEGSGDSSAGSESDTEYDACNVAYDSGYRVCTELEGLGSTMLVKTSTTRKRPYNLTPSYTSPVAMCSNHTPYRHRQSLNIQCTGNIFNILIDQVTGPLRDVQVMCIVLRILTVLATGCSSSNLDRYVVLLKQDKALISLLSHSVDKDSPKLSVSVLSLLTALSLSVGNITELCSNGKPCLLSQCYDLCYKFSGSPLKMNVMSELTKFLHQASLTTEGCNVLFNSNCCSDELLKALVSGIVECLEDFDVHTIDSTTTSCMAVQRMLILVHRMRQADPNFSLHKAHCREHYVHCISVTYQIFKDTPIEESLIYLLELEGLEEEEGVWKNSELLACSNMC